jgi:hypothetical protein
MNRERAMEGCLNYEAKNVMFRSDVERNSVLNMLNLLKEQI